MLCSATTVFVTSESATRRCRVEKCTPATMPRARARVTCWARRPLRVLGVVCSTPDAVSSLTMLETVAGDRPVAPANSTWVSPPCFLTASTIRARLASRSEVCDPGVALVMLTELRYMGDQGTQVGAQNPADDGHRSRGPALWMQR